MGSEDIVYLQYVPANPLSWKSVITKIMD